MSFPLLLGTFWNCPFRFDILHLIPFSANCIFYRPANGAFTVELAVNRAFTSLSYNGMNAGIYPDGQNQINLTFDSNGRSGCISEPNSVYSRTFKGVLRSVNILLIICL